MAKHTQTIRRQIAGELFECVWPFYEIDAWRVKHCSILTDDEYGTILIGDSVMAKLRRYQNIWNRNFSLHTLNCGIG